MWETDTEEDRMKSMEPEEGDIYIVYEARPEISMQVFRKKLEEGDLGLIISRTHTDRLKREWGLDVPHIWLARGNTNEFIQAVHPERLMKMHTIISSFITSSDRSKIILLDGLEYLISQNDFGTIMRFIQLVNEQVNTSQTCMLVPVHPRALDEQQKGIMEREVKVLSTEDNNTGELHNWLSSQSK